MLLKAFKRLFLSDNTISRFQDNVFEFTEQFSQVPIVNGALIQDVTIGTSVTLVPHKLGMAPQGYFIAKQTANATIYNIESKTDDKFLALQASSSVKISIWVF